MNRPERAATHDDRREAIIDAASRVFAEKGFSDASNREIAREAGISPGLIYWYFENKDELFKAVVRRLFPLYGMELPAVDVREMPLEDLLRMIGGYFLRTMTNPDVLRLSRLALTEQIRFPDVWREIGYLIANQAIGRLAAQLDARIEQGELPPTDTWLASQAFFGSLMAYVLRKYMFQSVDLQEANDDAMVATVVRIYAAGLKSGGQESPAPV